MNDTIKICLGVGTDVGLNILILFLLMAIGFVFAKKGIITSVGIKQMTEVLLTAVVPCVIINAYQRPFDTSMATNLSIAVIFALVIHLVAIFVVPLLFKSKSDNRYKINIFSVIYSNAGFIALPLVQATYGQEGVFYAVAYLTVFNILYWTHGVYVYTGDIKKLSLKKAFTTPGVIGTLIGVSIFLLQIELPSPIQKTISYMATLNTPLPMLILGAYLVNLDIKKVLKNKEMWYVCFLRLIVFPLVTILMANLFRIPEAIKLPLVLSSACPVAVVATLFASRYGLDFEYSSQVVSMTNVLSIITIPIIMALAVLF